MSRFDLAVLTVLGACALLLSALVWQEQADRSSDDLSHLLFTTVDEVGRAQLHALPLADGAFPAEPRPAPLTAAGGGIWDFAPSPDGSRVVYSALGPLGISDLRWIELASGQDALLLSCENGACSGPSWSPDGAYLAFTRRNVNVYAAGPLSPPRIWLMDVASGQTAPIFSDSQRLGLDARWSADGAWLCYVSPDPQGLGVFNVRDGRNTLYPSATGETCTWDKQRPSRLYTTESWQEGEAWGVHLIAVDVESGARVNLSGSGARVDDSTALPSPDGAWLAFRRKELDGPGASRGKQIWRMRPDGGDAHPLTTDPAYDHGPPVWSPDGRTLITRRFPLQGGEIVASLWTIDVETAEARHLLEPGDYPAMAP